MFAGETKDENVKYDGLHYLLTYTLISMLTFPTLSSTKDIYISMNNLFVLILAKKKKNFSHTKKWKYLEELMSKNQITVEIREIKRDKN